MRVRMTQAHAGDEVLTALCAAAASLGIQSLRAVTHALTTAKALATLRGDVSVNTQDAALAAQLTMAHRATQIPTPVVEDATENSETAPQPEQDAAPDDESALQNPMNDEPLEDRVLQAVKAAIHAGLLAQLVAQAKAPVHTQSNSGGRAGALLSSQRRGRPIGAKRGHPRSGLRLNVIETLRAAVPWQRLRHATQATQVTQQTALQKKNPQRIQIRKDDFHITRLKQRSETTTLFVVDASGSSALHRLAEAKGAVELLLADCYVRRDKVAMIAFRNTQAELVLPPTRSLVRAKRSLAALPGGGGTPLASAIDSAANLTQQLLRQGNIPILVFLTDGKGNITRDGTPGRVIATEQALAAARLLSASRVRSILIDTSREPQPQARALAEAMHAQYLPLPYADASLMSRAIQSSMQSSMQSSVQSSVG